MQSKINKLNSALKALERTISSTKNDVKIRISDEICVAWLKRVNLISSKFKTLFSDINNDQFDHLYKMSKKAKNVWENVSYDLNWMKNNIHDVYRDVGHIIDSVVGFEEGDLSVLFEEEKPGKSETSTFYKDLSVVSKNSTELLKRKADDQNVSVPKKSKDEETKNNLIENNDLETISDEEFSENESSIINTCNVVDEVGEVDLSYFEDMLKSV